ncbi:cytochrome C oxidase copper chaperone-domain-containing protein [Phellopilus nigrolimitatus]|nr:cytochrome C oxidase copper chaperone-domain-containing protein [Phellopilus nigrolimitatus]
MAELLTSWWGGSPAPAPTPAPANPLNPQGLKPCCACPETKAARDACFFNTDPDAADERCRELVAAHVRCMRGYGFAV